MPKSYVFSCKSSEWVCIISHWCVGPSTLLKPLMLTQTHFCTMVSDCKERTEYIWLVTSPGEDKLRSFTWCGRLTDLANHIRICVTLVTFIVLFLHIHSQEKPFVLKIENTFFQYRNVRSVPKSDTPMFFSANHVSECVVMLAISATLWCRMSIRDQFHALLNCQPADGIRYLHSGGTNCLIATRRS